MTESSPSVASSPRPRILIAENNFSTVDSLLQTIGDKRLDLVFDVCTSHKVAALKLVSAPYHVIISGAHLAEIEDFYLLRRNQALQPLTPFVVTFGSSEKESANRVLGQGAFDLIPTPLDHEQTVNTIRLALWQSKLKGLIARREKTIENYRQLLDAYPGNRKMNEEINSALSSIQETVSSFGESIQRIEESINCFADLAKIVERQAREHAFGRLTALPKNIIPL
jgi:DNA-binding NtrC family response regulator